MGGLRIAGAIAAALIGAAFAPSAVAQEAGSRQSRDFVAAAAESDAFEMAEAESALALSKDPQVLAFARMMIRDHSQTSQALRNAATSAGLAPPPMGVGAGLSPFLAALQSERGAAFDRAYWRQQALAHRAALVTQQNYAATGDVPALRRTATAAIPIIESHLTMAERMSAAPDS